MTDFSEFLRGAAEPVDKALDLLLPPAEDPPVRLHEAMRYSIFAGGKRVRPALLLLAGESYGAPLDDLLPGAAAVEMVHTFSLVHDDLPALDDDDLRRGRPTLHKQYDEALAVLAGDALLNLAFGVLATLPESAAGESRSRAVALMSEAVGGYGMIGGQVEDIEAEGEWPQDPAGALAEIHRKKTGLLLCASLRLGGLYADAGTDGDELLGRLGKNIGMMFQIGDDVLDIESDTTTLGKTSGKDAEANKLTYVELFGVEESRRRLHALRDEAQEMLAGLPGNRTLFWSLLDFLVERDR